MKLIEKGIKISEILLIFPFCRRKQKGKNIRKYSLSLNTQASSKSKLGLTTILVNFSSFMCQRK